MQLSVLFAVTLLIAGSSTPTIKFVTAPDADYASEMVLANVYGEVIDVQEVNLPDDADEFVNGFFTIDPEEICTRPLSDIFPDAHDDENKGRRFEFNGVIVEVLETFPNGNVHVENLETGEEFMTDIVYLDEIN
jgi:hypothetical protein